MSRPKKPRAMKKKRRKDKTDQEKQNLARKKEVCFFAFPPSTERSNAASWAQYLSSCCMTAGVLATSRLFRRRSHGAPFITTVTPRGDPALGVCSRPRKRQEDVPRSHPQIPYPYPVRVALACPSCPLVRLSLLTESDNSQESAYLSFDAHSTPRIAVRGTSEKQ